MRKPHAVVLTAALILSGCLVEPGTPTGGRLFIFIDQSASIRRDQPRWETEARQLATVIEPGWNVTLFGIHDQTLGSPPLFQAEVPGLSPDAGMDEAIASKRAKLAARKGLIEAFQRALSQTARARQTDLLSAIDRIPHDRTGRPTLAVHQSRHRGGEHLCHRGRRAVPAAGGRREPQHPDPPAVAAAGSAFATGP